MHYSRRRVADAGDSETLAVADGEEADRGMEDFAARRERLMTRNVPKRRDRDRPLFNRAIVFK